MVITSALHAEGPGFNPQWNQNSYCRPGWGQNKEDDWTINPQWHHWCLHTQLPHASVSFHMMWSQLSIITHNSEWHKKEVVNVWNDYFILLECCLSKSELRFRHVIEMCRTSVFFHEMFTSELHAELHSLNTSRFHSVVVITSALHAEGPGFNPQWNQNSLMVQKCNVHIHRCQKQCLAQGCSTCNQAGLTRLPPLTI